MILFVVAIVFSILTLTNVHVFEGFNSVGLLVYYVIALLVCLLLIAVTRIAKNKKSSKGWDLLLMILGIISWNIFYFLGGLFGLIAIR